MASRRPPEALAAQARAIEPKNIPRPLAEMVETDSVILTYPVPRRGRRGGGESEDQLEVDAINAHGTPLADFGWLTSSALAAKHLTGALFLKGSLTCPPAKLAADPGVNGGRRVIFIAEEDGDALGQGAALMQRLGYAPISLGSLAEGSPLTSSRGNA